MMTTNQIGRLDARISLIYLGKYGLGFGLIQTPAKGERDAGSGPLLLGWLFSTNFWIDPRHDLVAVIMTQVLPTNHGGALGVFRREVESAIQ